MRVITQNSVYTVEPVGSMFLVQRSASTWGQHVIDRHVHYSAYIELGVGWPFVTSNLRTTNVLAITAD